MLGNDVLMQTLEAYARCGMNARKAGRELCITDATIYGRLNRIKVETGVNPKTFAGLAELLGYKKIRGTKI